MAGSAKAPLVDLEAGAGAYGTLDKVGFRHTDESNKPSKVVLNRVGGEKQEVNVAPRLPAWMEKFGVTAPPGGWYGPHGFLRMIGYFFLLWAIGALLCAVYCIIEEEFTEFLVALLLAPVALLASFTAWANEGLATQVTVMAEANGKFATKVQEAERQLQSLSGTRQKLDSMGGEWQGNINDLTAMAENMDFFANVGKVTTVLRAFMDQETKSAMTGAGQAMDGSLRDPLEIVGFAADLEATFKEKVAEADNEAQLEYLQKLLLARQTVVLKDLVLLNGALCTENLKEAKTMLELLCFLVDSRAEKHTDDVLKGVGDHLEDDEFFGTASTLKEELERLKALPEKQGRVPYEESHGLVQAVLRKFVRD